MTDDSGNVLAQMVEGGNFGSQAIHEFCVDPGLALPSDLLATDNCGAISYSVVSDTTAGDCAGNYTIVRTFTATDDAGNSASATQTITVEDTTAPEFTSIPADYTSECSDDLILMTLLRQTTAVRSRSLSTQRRLLVMQLATTRLSARSQLPMTVATARPRLRRLRLRTRLPLSSRASQQTTRLSALTT